jgi:hypothetical protein
MLLKKMSDVVKETLAKNVKEIKSNLQNTHATAHSCWQGGGVGRETKLGLWAELSPFPSWYRKYAVEKNVRCSKRNMSEKHEGN